MKLRWTTTEIESLFFQAHNALNSQPWRGHAAETVRCLMSGVRSGDDWTVTAEIVSAPPPVEARDVDGSVIRFAVYPKTDFATVIPESAVEV